MNQIIVGLTKLEITIRDNAQFAQEIKMIDQTILRASFRKAHERIKLGARMIKARSK